ncbi:MAG TPA: hypothetical protein PLY93_03260 [Turneriella sp.]|nr:hypothetical protein [Turneriella sp.]
MGLASSQEGMRGMKKIPLTLTFFSLFFLYCSAQSERNPTVVAAEENARKKPLLNPPSGVYYGALNVQVLDESGAPLEYSTGGNFQLLVGNNLNFTESTTVVVRNANNTALSTIETYAISSTFATLSADPPPGVYSAVQLVSLYAPQKNVSIEVYNGSTFEAYNGEQGITIPATRNVIVRQCVAGNCSANITLNYQINIPGSPPPAPRALTEAEIATFVSAAGNTYKQIGSAGLAAVLDDAKLLVINTPSLIPSESLRQRFLGQDNQATAQENCTTIARYLYVMARRITLEGHTLPAFPDYSRYFIDQIVEGNLTVDSGGRNFVWVANGAALVTPYLPADALSPYDYQRGTTYPNDFSILDKLVSDNPFATLLRDGPSASSNTHTFMAIKSTAGYTMIDTYFTPFNGVETRASAGGAYPYAYRFGPNGSRWLHFVYGY